MNRTAIALTVILLFFSRLTHAHGQDAPSGYIDKYKALAGEMMQQYRIPVSVILGIAMVESGSGTSVLSRKLHNHFGIVGKNRNAMKKIGYRTRYREYASDTASFEHFCRVISKKSFYESLSGNMEYSEWVKAIRKSGYATAAGHWEKKVLAMIRNHRLNELDLEMADPLNR